MNERPVRELIEAYVNGEAGPEQFALLEQELLVNEAARDAYLNYINLHSALRRRFLTPGDDSALDLNDFRLAMAQESLAPRRTRWGMKLLALALSIGLLLGLYAVYQTRLESWRTTATVQSLEGEAELDHGSGVQPVRVGDSFRSGDTLRLAAEGARVVLAYPDGTQVNVHPGSVVQAPRSEVRLQLLSGSLEVDAARQPPNRPLIFESGRTRYVVLGTRFRLYREQESARLELDEGKVRLERPAGKTVEVAAGNVAIAADESSAVEILPLSLGAAQLHHSLKRAGQNVAFSPEGDLLLTNDQHSGLQIWRVSDMSLHSDRTGKAGFADGLLLAPGGQVVRFDRANHLQVWRPGEDSAIEAAVAGQHTRSRALSPEGNSLAVAIERGTFVYGIDLESGNLRERFARREHGKAWCLALSTAGERLAAGFWDGTTQVLEVDSGDVLFSRKLKHTPTHAALTPDGLTLVVFTQRDGLLLIDVASGSQRELWPAGSEMVRCLRFSADGRYVLAGMNDRTARMWSADDGRPLLVVDAGHSPQGIAWSERDQLLATADGTVKLWKCKLQTIVSQESQP